MKLFILMFFIVSTSSATVLERDGNGFRLTRNKFSARELLKDYSALSELNLSVSPDFTDQTFEIHGNRKLSREMVEGFVSRIMDISGNAFIVKPQSPFVEVISARDARYATVPVYEDESMIPYNDNYIQFNFRLKHADPADLARNMRPFLSRYGRVVDVKHARTVHLMDNASNVRRLIQISKIIDVPSFKEGKKEIDSINEKHRKILKNEKDVLAILLENNGIFLVVFLVLGIILGFGIRGYVIKRVEGGW